MGAETNLFDLQCSYGGSGGKVGVTLKTNFQCEKPIRKANLCALFSYRIDPAEYAKQKFLKPEFCGKTSMAICAIFDDRRCEKRAFEG